MKPYFFWNFGQIKFHNPLITNCSWSEGGRHSWHGWNNDDVKVQGLTLMRDKDWGPNIFLCWYSSDLLLHTELNSSFLLPWQNGLSSKFIVSWYISYFSQQRELQFHLLCLLVGCIEDFKLMVSGRGTLINRSGFRVVNLFCSNEILLIEYKWSNPPCAIFEILLLSKCKIFSFCRPINASSSMFRTLFQDKYSSIRLVKRWNTLNSRDQILLLLRLSIFRLFSSTNDRTSITEILLLLRSSSSSLISPMKDLFFIEEMLLLFKWRCRSLLSPKNDPICIVGMLLFFSPNVFRLCCAADNPISITDILLFWRYKYPSFGSPEKDLASMRETMLSFRYRTSSEAGPLNKPSSMTEILLWERCSIQSLFWVA